MLGYYFSLGLRSLRRNPVLTALMVLTLAVGVAASVSTLTILHIMSGDPIPDKSTRLLVPQLDNGPLLGYVPGEPLPQMLSYRDAVNLLAGKQGLRRSAVFSVGAGVEQARPDLPVIPAGGVAAGRDFFAMFEVPLLYGQPWSEADDSSGADVIVITRALSEKLYGSANPVGRRIVLGGQSYEITGVIGDWHPQPRYYSISGANPFATEDDFILPFRSAIRHQTDTAGNMSCSGEGAQPGYQGKLDSECVWIQFWFELASVTERGALQDYLDAYSADQHKLGRLPRLAKAQLSNVMEWLDRLHVVGNDSRLSAWLAFGFLLLCLVNTIGLLLAKFSVRAAEVGIRRALGASRGEIFRQFLIETSVIGLSGGLLGLLLAAGALQLIKLQSETMARVAHLDLAMLLLTFGLALAAALLAGLLPTWRACLVTPALQLKSQ